MQGQRRCRFHGGKSPQALRAAQRRMEEARIMTVLGRLGVEAPDGVSPADALDEAMRLALGDIRALRSMVGEIDLTDADQLPALVNLYERSADRLARVSKAAVDAGLAERMAAISEENVRVIAEAVQRAVDEVPMELETKHNVLAAVARELRSVRDA